MGVDVRVGCRKARRIHQYVGYSVDLVLYEPASLRPRAAAPAGCRHPLGGPARARAIPVSACRPSHDRSTPGSRVFPSLAGPRHRNFEPSRIHLRSIKIACYGDAVSKLSNEIRAIRIRQPIFKYLAGQKRREHAIARLLSSRLVGSSHQLLDAIPGLQRNSFHGRAPLLVAARSFRLDAA